MKEHLYECLSCGEQTESLIRVFKAECCDDPQYYEVPLWAKKCCDDEDRNTDGLSDEASPRSRRD